jgi:hypothetical protein
MATSDGTTDPQTGCDSVNRNVVLARDHEAILVENAHV